MKLNRSQLQNEVSDMESKKKPHKKEVCWDFLSLAAALATSGPQEILLKMKHCIFASSNGFNVFLITDKGQSAAVVNFFVLAEANK